MHTQSATPGEVCNVEQWSTQEVVDWLFSLSDGPLSQYAMLFEQQHISGRNLLGLTGEDLLELGMVSLGHRKLLLEEVEKLRRDNHRLLHFPPLQQQQQTKVRGRGDSSRGHLLLHMHTYTQTYACMQTHIQGVARAVPLQPIVENITVIFGSLCRQGSTPQVSAIESR